MAPKKKQTTQGGRDAKKESLSEAEAAVRAPMGSDKAALSAEKKKSKEPQGGRGAKT